MKKLLSKLVFSKRPSMVFGVFGGIVVVCVAPALFCTKHYILGALFFFYGLVIIDWNREGQ